MNKSSTKRELIAVTYIKKEKDGDFPVSSDKTQPPVWCRFNWLNWNSYATAKIKKERKRINQQHSLPPKKLGKKKNKVKMETKKEPNLKKIM